MRFAGLRKAAVTAAVLGVVGTSAGVDAAASSTAQDDDDIATFDQAAFGAQGDGPARLTAAVQMTEDDLAPTRGFTGPSSMLAHPDDPDVIVAATANLRSRQCFLVRSTNAGATWQILESRPSPEDYPRCTSGIAGVGQASIAWGRDATLYYALLGYGDGEGAREGKESLVLARSTDLGDTWTTTVVEDNRGETEGNRSASGVTALVVDSSGGQDVVHIGYSQAFDDAAEDSPLSDDPVVVATSTDGGETFGEPVNINDFSEVTGEIAGDSYPLIMNSSFGRPFLAVHDGVLLAVSDSKVPFDEETPGDSYHPLPLLVARSTDQGETWTVESLGPPIYTGTGAQTGMGWTPEGGPEGTFLAAYAATPETADSSGTADIVLQRSTDGGVTWSEPLAIDDDDPADRFTSFYPQLGVAPNGRVDVVWQDNREEADFRFNVRYSYSTDGGVSWAENVQVNDQPLDFNLGISFNSDIRQPPGVASADEYAAFGWADSRLGDEVSQTQDNFGAIAQFSSLPGDSSALPIAAAAFGGLSVAGVVLLIVMRRRRVGGPTPARAAPA